MKIALKTAAGIVTGAFILLFVIGSQSNAFSRGPQPFVS
jgi:hypothetical protein